MTSVLKKSWEQTFTRVIQSTEAEYHRGLMQAFPGCVFVEKSLLIEWRNVKVAIDVRLLPDFSVGLVRLPMMEVTWNFLSGIEDQQQALLKKADLSMQRGLG